MRLESNSQKRGKVSQKCGKITDLRFWHPSRILLALFILGLPFETAAILHLIPMASDIFSGILSKTNLANSYYPASIPWIEDSYSCEKSGRNWEDDKCWDADHSPKF
jgi:hypothetical protein